MSTVTQFQQLTKPAYADPLDIAVLNADLDKLDKIGVVLCTASTRPNTNLFAGLTIYETDTKFLRTYNGTSWGTGRTECTHATRPATGLIAGDTIYETDTLIRYTWNGSAWVAGPQGLLSEAHFTGNTSQNITSAVQTTVTGNVSTDNGAGAAGNLAVTVAVKNGRKYKATLNLNLFSTVANDIVQAGMIASSGTLTSFQPRYSVPTTAGEGFAINGWFYAAADASVTFTAQASRQGGTGNINCGAGSSIAVEDVGP